MEPWRDERANTSGVAVQQRDRLFPIEPKPLDPAPTLFLAE